MRPAGGRTRWVALVLVLLAVAWGVYEIFDRAADLGPSLAANQFLLPALSLALVVLVLALAAVLIRNLVRLILDRKRGLLGSRLRTKLVFFFLALVLLPAAVLFSGSAQLIKKSVEAMLRTPLEDLTRQSGEIVAQWRDYFEDQAQRQADGLATMIRDSGALDPRRGAELARLVERWQREHELDVAWIAEGAQPLVQAETPRQGPVADELQRLISGLAQDAWDSGRPIRRINHLGDGLLAHAASLLEGTDGRRAVVVVGMVLPTRLAGNLEGFLAAEQAYRQFRVQRRELVRLYLTQIGLIFLVTVFIATWIGFYISRRITVPIQEVAAAAREISAGNLDVRVESQTGDEVGMLVEAFNEMASELEESRAVITRSTADLRHSNRALDERRRYIETLLANLSTAVLSMDNECCVTTANPAVLSILGLDVAVGSEALVAFRRPGLEPLAELVSAGALPDAQELRHDLALKRGVQTLQVAAQVSPLRGAAGERAGTLVMVEDLTDLVQAQRAAAWREVARRIAHEIKNPLTPIQLAAQRLRKKYTEGAADLERVVPEATASIEREVANLKQLVDEFSRFARMPEVEPRVVDFPALVESVLALYKGLQEIDLELELDPQLGQASLDPQQIRRALINLIDNAVAALDGKGTIRIRAQPMAGERGLRIEVADSGPGIPPADRDKLFVPYFSTKRRGTGLGLAIVHKVVTDHRGTIRVENNDPRGARFVIEIPA